LTGLNITKTFLKKEKGNRFNVNEYGYDDVRGDRIGDINTNEYEDDDVEEFKEKGKEEIL
jgi:hypothetical protein